MAAVISVHVGIIETKSGKTAREAQNAASRRRYSASFELTNITSQTAVGRVLASHIATRVQRHGKTPKPFKGYAGVYHSTFTYHKAMQGREHLSPNAGKTVATIERKGKKMGYRAISPRYPATGGRIGKSGARFFDDTRAFQAAQGTKPGTFNVSGGMWSGLNVRVFGNRTRIQFMGRSEGQGMQHGPGKPEPHFRYMKTTGRVEARPRKVSNALKGGTVFKSTGVNVLEPLTTEIVDIHDAYTEAAKLRMRYLSTWEVKWDGHALRSRLAREMFHAAARAMG